MLTGISPDAIDTVNKSLAGELRDYENMELVAQLSIQGNLPCLTCGEGDGCEMSGVKMMFGPDAKTSDFEYSRVETQNDVMKEAERIGRLIGERVR